MASDDDDHIGHDYGARPINAGTQPRQVDYVPRPSGSVECDKINSQYAPKIDSRVPTDCHPAQIDAFALPLAKLGQPGLAILRTAKQVLDSHYTELSLQQAAVDASQRPNLNPITQRMQPTYIDENDKPALLAALSQSFERDAQRNARLSAVIDQGINQIEVQLKTGLEKHFGTTDEAAMMTGIWEYTARLTPDARAKFLESIVKTNQRTVVAALLRFNTPFLAGMTPDDQERLRQSAERAWFPDLTNALQSANQIRATCRRARDIAVNKHMSLRPTIRVAANSQAMDNLRKGRRA